MKKLIYLLLVIILVGLFAFYVKEKQEMPYTTLEERIMANAKPGIDVLSDLNSDEKEEQIIVNDNWRGDGSTALSIYFEDGTFVTKEYKGKYLSHFYLVDKSEDHTIHIVLCLESVDEKIYESRNIVLQYQNNMIEEVDINVRREQKDVLDRRKLYCANDNFSKEISADFNGDGKMDLVQVRDNSFSGESSLTKIRLWINHKESLDYNIENEFLGTLLKSVDINNDGKDEILVLQSVIASTYGAKIIRILSLCDNQIQEYPLPIEIQGMTNIIDASIKKEENRVVLQVSVLMEKLPTELVNTYFYEYKSNGWNLIHTEEIVDYYHTN